MTEPILGIDIAKLKFNVCLIQQSGKLKHKLFANTASGFEQLSEWLSKQGVRACPRLPGSHRHLWRSALPLSAPGRSHSQRHQPGGHQSLCSKPAVTHQNRPRGCRTDRTLLPGASTARLDTSAQQKCENYRHLSAAWNLSSRCEWPKRIGSRQASRSRLCAQSVQEHLAYLN